MNIFIIMLLSYLLGSIPFAYLITRLTTGQDVRNLGSGNVGATNAARAMGFKFGLLVGILDILKGVLAVVIARFLLPAQPEYYFFIASFLVIIGHNWSVFLKFSGGKGVATTFGVLITIYPFILPLLIVIWIILVLITHYVSLASIIAAGSVPILIFLFKGNLLDVAFSLILAVLVIVRHSTNIKRLIKGNENKMKWPPTVKKGDL